MGTMSITKRYGTITILNGSGVSDLTSVTANVKPELTSATGIKVTTEINTFISEQSFIGIAGNIPDGTYSIFRGTQLQTSFGNNNTLARQQLDIILQYLYDIAGVQQVQADALFNAKFLFELQDHTLSMHSPDSVKPVKNPIYGEPSTLNTKESIGELSFINAMPMP